MSDRDLEQPAEQLSRALWSLVSDAANNSFEGNLRDNESVQEFAEALLSFMQRAIAVKAE
jgi:FPC/CPF motif-containing protein YcgG